MIELLGSNLGVAPQTGDVLFLYDPATNKDLITNTVVGALRANTVLDNGILIDDHPSIRINNAAGGVVLSIPGIGLNLEALTNWTLEWSSLPVTFGTGFYCELLMDVTNSANVPIGSRWTNSGYGDRLQFNAANWDNNHLWRTQITKAQAANKLIKRALVRNKDMFYVFEDGKRIMLENGVTANTIKRNYFLKTMLLPTVTRMYLGWYNSTNQAFIGNYGRVRFSNFARYVYDYTPKPF